MNGWVEACANGRLGGRGGLQKLITFLGGCIGAEMVSSIVMSNFGVGPWGDPIYQLI